MFNVTFNIKAQDTVGIIAMEVLKSSFERLLFLGAVTCANRNGKVLDRMRKLI